MGARPTEAQSGDPSLPRTAIRTAGVQSPLPPGLMQQRLPGVGGDPMLPGTIATEQRRSRAADAQAAVRLANPDFTVTDALGGVLREYPGVTFADYLQAFRIEIGESPRLMRENAVRKLLGLPETAIFCAGGYPPNEAQPSAELLAELEVHINEDFAYPKGALNGSERVSQYGKTTGLDPLRDLLHDRLNERGVVVKNSTEVLVGNGSQEILYGIAKALLSKNLPDGHSIQLGGVVAVEAPTYIGALDAFDANGASYVHIPKDANGIVTPEGLEAMLTQAEAGGDNQRIKMVYLGPTFQNPTGVTMPYETRAKIAEVMGRHKGTVLVEDNPYGEIRWSGEPLEPSIQSLMRGKGYKNAVYVSTFSKTFSPGDARVGYAVFPEDLVITDRANNHVTLASAYLQEKQSNNLFTSLHNQALAYAYVKHGYYDRDLPEKIRMYREKSEALFDAISKSPLPPGVKINKPQGGMFLYIELPEGMNADAVSEALLTVDKTTYPDDEQVGIVPTAAFYGDQQLAKRNGIRMCYTTETPDRLRIAGRKLNRVLNQLAA